MRRVLAFVAVLHVSECSEYLQSEFDRKLAAASGTGRTVFIGDSDIEGWRSVASPDDSATLVPGSSNIGVGGATATDVRGWMQAVALAVASVALMVRLRLHVRLPWLRYPHDFSG